MWYEGVEFSAPVAFSRFENCLCIEIESVKRLPKNKTGKTVFVSGFFRISNVSKSKTIGIGAPCMSSGLHPNYISGFMLKSVF